MKKIVSILMATLMLLSTLSTVFLSKPVSAVVSENNNPSENSLLKRSTTTLQSKTNPDLSSNLKSASQNPIKELSTKSSSTSQNLNEQSIYDPDRWEFNNASVWSQSAYLDGNKTRLIVGLDKSTNPLELEKATAKFGSKVTSEVSIGGKVRAVVVELPLASVAAFVEEVRRVGLAAYVEPNMKVQVQLVPNDPYWSRQWGPRKIEADWAWDSTRGNMSVLVAIVDTGIDYTHPDLASNYAPLGFDWVNSDPDPIDDFGHGTHCAGIVAAVLNNHVGIAGMAQVRIMAEKVLDSGGSGYWDWVANGITHAVDQGANIVSLSLGGYGESETIHEAVRYAQTAGVLVVAATGNDNTNMRSYPAAYDEVVAVSATDQYDNKAGFSNWGDWIELAAPGVEIYSTMPTYHVTLNDYGYSMEYDYLSGTSMACPHVSGVAALVWSRYPNATGDWVRLWLRSTADDLGIPGFDEYFGYGRVNARKAVGQSLPSHELVAYAWNAPPYVKPGSSATIELTILNFGQNDEANVVVDLLANGTVESSAIVGFIPCGSLATASLTWSPIAEGIYNVTAYVEPVAGETFLDNNALSENVYVGPVVKAVVLHSAGNVIGEAITNWQALNTEWNQFGDMMVCIDYTTLNKESITYEDITATEADVLIISCAYDPYAGWQFMDSEIEAIERYTHEGHGLIVTAGTLYYQVPNNNKLARLLGLNEATVWGGTSNDLLHLLNRTHPIFRNVPDPFVFQRVGTSLPADGRWDSTELNGGKYLAFGHFNEAAIVGYRGLVYVSSWLEVIPPYYSYHLQLLYNAITWSQYQRPEHELAVSLESPRRLEPGETAILNATVTNEGLSNETDVELRLLINNSVVCSATIPELKSRDCYTISYSWSPVEAHYNLTAFAPPVFGEESTLNNVDSALVYVSTLKYVLWDDAHDGDGDSLLGNYRNLYDLLTANAFIVDDLTSGTINRALLASYDILVLIDPELEYLSSEIADIQDWVAAGGGLIIIPDGGYPSSLNTLMAPYGVQVTGRYGGYGTTTDILPDPITQNVQAIFVNWVREISVARPSTCLAWASEYGERYAFLSSTEDRTVTVVSDSNIMDNDGLGLDDNTQLMLNVFNLAGVSPEHDLAVSLDAPVILEPGNTALLNAEVRNQGKNNETLVELQLLINGTIVDQVILPELLTNSSFALDYLWTPTIEGVYNITAFVLPVPDEEFTANNVASASTTVHYVIARVAVLNSMDIPSYFYGGWSNNYQMLVDALSANGFYAQAVTNEEIAGGILSFFDVFVMIDNAPSDATVPYVTAFWANGGGIVAFDSSICFLCYSGILPPESSGNSGLSTYWDYGTSSQAKISVAHPITEGYEVGQIVYGTSGDAEYWADALASTSAYPYYTKLVEDVYMPNRAYVSAYEPPAAGNVAHIWDNYHWGNAGLQTMILNAITWAKGYRYQHDLGITLEAPTSAARCDSIQVNATVTNRGLSNETGVELELFINGTAVESQNITELLSGVSYTISHVWTPTVGGTYYNITAFVVPVPDENFTSNNYATKTVYVSLYARKYLPPNSIGGGNPMGWHADDASWPFNLPFVFPFYDKFYGTIYISSNGLITFNEPDSSYSNSLSALAGKFAVAIAWDDWVTYEPYDIYTWQNETCVWIQWIVRHYGAGTVANFEAILRSDGVIQFNYGYSDGLASATVGISNGAGDMLAEDLTDLNYIKTIKFVPHLLKHDVAITSVEASPSEVMVGDTVNVHVVTENQGNFTESYTVTAYATSQPNSTIHVNTLNSTRIFLDPNNYIFDAAGVSIGYRFNVTVKVEDATNLAGWQVCLRYNDTIINVTRWFEPTWDPTYVFYGRMTSAFPQPPEVGYMHEGLDIGVAKVAGMLFPPDQPPFYGSGKLCIIEFEVRAIPPPEAELSCDLVMDSGDTFLIDFYGYEIPDVQKDNGYYALVWGGPSPPPGIYVIGTAVLADMPPGSGTVLTFLWNTTGVPSRSYIVWAEASVIPGEIDTADNRYIDGVVRIKKYPVARFTYSPEFPSPGETVVFNASASTPDGGTIVGYYWDFGDGSNASTPNSIQTHAYSSSGLFSIALTITDSDGLKHSTWRIIYVFIRDVAVVNIVTLPTEMYVGRTLTINVTVTNEGEVSETFNVTLYYNLTAGRRIGVQQVSSLPPGGSTTLTFIWNTTGVNPHVYDLRAIAAQVLGETDTLDNVLSTTVKVKMLGDINGDGKVDLKDYFMVSKAYGEVLGRPRWDSECDINDDGKIDLKDVYIVARNFGKVY